MQSNCTLIRWNECSIKRVYWFNTHCKQFSLSLSVVVHLRFLCCMPPSFRNLSNETRLHRRYIYIYIYSRKFYALRMKIDLTRKKKQQHRVPRVGTAIAERQHNLLRFCFAVSSLLLTFFGAKLLYDIIWYAVLLQTATINVWETSTRTCTMYHVQVN